MCPYSVVIPAYNAARTLAETLASVLAQTSPPAEVIVIDDGSTDGTAALAAACGAPVRLIRQANTGPGGACSRGVRAATSPWVALVDADDLWLPAKMSRQLQALAADPGLAAIGCKMRQFEHGRDDDGTGEVRGGLNRSNLVFRREVFAEVGDMIDPPGNRGDMIDWLARMRETGHRTAELDEVLALRRIIPGSLSYGRAPERDLGYLKVAHLAMLRRRKKAQEGGSP